MSKNKNAQQHNPDPDPAPSAEQSAIPTFGEFQIRERHWSEYGLNQDEINELFGIDPNARTGKATNANPTGAPNRKGQRIYPHTENIRAYDCPPALYKIVYDGELPEQGLQECWFAVFAANESTAPPDKLPDSALEEFIGIIYPATHHPAKNTRRAPRWRTLYNATPNAPKPDPQALPLPPMPKPWHYAATSHRYIAHDRYTHPRATLPHPPAPDESRPKRHQKPYALEPHPPKAQPVIYRCNAYETLLAQVHPDPKQTAVLLPYGTYTRQATGAPGWYVERLTDQH